MMTWIIANVWHLSFLTIAVADDLVYKKFHNALFIALTLVGVVYVFSMSPLSWQDSLGGFFIGGGLLLPLVLLNAIGAGDMKFMMAFGILLGTTATISVVIYAFFWGALLGVLKTVLGGQLKTLLTNMAQIASKQTPKKTIKIPFTVAILLGWLCYVQMGGAL